MQGAVDQAVGAGFVDFGEVGTLLMLFAHDVYELFGGVGIVGVGENVLRGIVAIGVFVAAKDIDGVAADAQARPGDEALIDGVANRRIGRTCAFRSHIAFCGEAGHDIGFSSLLGEKGAPWNGLHYRLQVFGAGVQKEMDMRVDETGEKRGVAEVDHFYTLRMLDGFSNGANALAVDEYLAGLEQRT